MASDNNITARRQQELVDRWLLQAVEFRTSNKVQIIARQINTELVMAGLPAASQVEIHRMMLKACKRVAMVLEAEAAGQA
jgi:hypothetical protein